MESREHWEQSTFAFAEEKPKGWYTATLGCTHCPFVWYICFDARCETVRCPSCHKDTEIVYAEGPPYFLSELRKRILALKYGAPNIK